MAMTGTLIADFASFNAACDKAKVSLTSFETGSAKVETALNRMGDSFSGKKIISDATLMAKVFEDAGGRAAFTEKELARMGATGAEAAAKLKALGQDVPPGIAKIAAETKNVDKESNALIGTVKNLALGFVGMFTARAAFNFVKGTVAEAGALKDLAQQTHINVEELQILAGAMSEFGVDADTLGKGLFTLSRKISKGDDSVSDALKQMGMELKDVQGLNGEELFRTIMRGLAGLQGGLRDETASELFGSRLGMAMAGASEDIEGVIATWKAHNTVMSTDTVNALDAADEAIKRSNRSLSMMAANLMGPVAEGFNTLWDALGKGMSNWDFMIANARDLTDSMIGTGTGTEHLTRLLDGLNQKTDAAKTATKGATGAQREFVPALDDTTGATQRARDAAAQLTKEIEKQEAAYQKLNSEIANEKGLAQMEEAAATMARETANKKQLWMMERDAATMAHADRERALSDAAAAEVGYLKEQDAITAANDAMSAATPLHKEAGAAAVSATDAAMIGYMGVAQQVQITGDAIKEWIELMKYSAQVNAILSTNSLFTTTSQYQAIANLSAPAMAMGGSVSADRPYIVGERGPELFVPKQSGSILPNRGGDSRPQVINLVVDGQVLASIVNDRTKRTLQQMGAV